MRYAAPMALKVRGRLLEAAFGRIAQVSGGREALMELLPEATRRRVEPIWIATAWYDAEIFFDVMAASARMQGIDPVDFIRRSSERAAEHDIQGIYRQTLRPKSPTDMAERLPRVFHRYYDTPLRVLGLEERSLRVDFGDVPAHRAEMFQALNEGFMGAALRIAGAQDVRFRWTQHPATSGCVACDGHVTWA